MNKAYSLIFWLAVVISPFIYNNNSLGSNQQSSIVEIFPELFSVDSIPTESTAWELLKTSEIPKGWTFLAVPWTTLINFNQINRVPSTYVDNSFTICQHINYRSILPLLKKMGVKVLFTPHVSKGNQSWNGITILPFPHYAVHGTSSAATKDILVSFIGADWTHRVRKKILALTHPNAYIKARKKWHWEVSKQQQEDCKTEYQSVLARSRFSICPRGTGPSTIRFWESLQAGAIPTSISDDLILPHEFDWSSCGIFIPESEAHNSIHIIEAIPPEKEAAMRSNCLRAYAQFQNEQFISTVIYNLNKLNTTKDKAG